MRRTHAGRALLIPVVALWGLGAQCGGNRTGPEIKNVLLTPTLVYKRNKKPIDDVLPPGITEIPVICLHLNEFNQGEALCWEDIVKIGPNEWKVNVTQQLSFNLEFFSWAFAQDNKMCEDPSNSCSCMEGNVTVNFKETGWRVNGEIINKINCDHDNSYFRFKVVRSSP